MNKLDVELARVELLSGEYLGPISKQARKTLLELSTMYLYGRIIENETDKV